MKFSLKGKSVYFLPAVFLLALLWLLSSYRGVSGRFLVATPQVAVSPFEKSVIYVVHHDLYRAYGFIINKKVPATDTGEHTIREIPGAPALYGGPIKYPAWVYILSRGPGGWPLFYPEPGPRYDGRNGMIEDARTLGDARVLAGQTGWGPLQLNLEIGRGSWEVIDYDPALLFDTPLGEIWDEALSRVEKKE